jgi:hypothetical protein
MGLSSRNFEIMDGSFLSLYIALFPSQSAWLQQNMETNFCLLECLSPAFFHCLDMQRTFQSTLPTEKFSMFTVGEISQNPINHVTQSFRELSHAFIDGIPNL